MKHSPKTYFHVSPFLNLYYSLEVSTGTIVEVYNEEYAEQMKRVFPEQILKISKELHDSQRFSWRIKSCLSDRISQNKLKKSMLLLTNEFNDLLTNAFSYYQTYWKRVSPNLVRARKVLEENKNELERFLAMTSDLLQIPWRIKELHIQLVDPFTGEPIGENAVSFGVGPIASLPSTDLAAISDFFISHEARHILVWDSIRRIAEKYTTEEHAEYIDEAVMNLIRNSIVKRDDEFKEKFWKAIEVAKKMNFPPPSYIGKAETYEGKIYKERHKKRNRYITYYKNLFQEDWEELLAKNKPFSKVIENLLKRNMEKIKNS